MEINRKEKNNRIIKNTNLLLEHYYDLKAFCEHTEAADEEVPVKSILRSRETTIIMLNHLEDALEMLREKCEKSDTPDKYTVMDMLHLDPSLQDMDWVERLGTVCLELEKSESTIRRWHSEMVQQLGIYLFGLDGLKLVT